MVEGSWELLGKKEGWPEGTELKLGFDEGTKTGQQFEFVVAVLLLVACSTKINSTTWSLGCGWFLGDAIHSWVGGPCGARMWFGVFVRGGWQCGWSFSACPRVGLWCDDVV